MRSSCLIIFLYAFGLLVTIPAQSADPANPHEITGQKPAEYCVACHLQPPSVYEKTSSQGIVPQWADFRTDIDGNSLCTTCHTQAEAGHEVGGEALDFTVPADLPLSADSKLSCVTCHYMHGSLSSERPWASVSLMDKMLNHERMHKSYLLRRNNSNGELCLVCHDINGPKSQ